LAENSAGGANALVSLRTLVILPDEFDIAKPSNLKEKKSKPQVF
jgi:hypothetical protein